MTYTWHHHQDGKTLMLVKQEVHSAFAHKGGSDLIQKGLKGLFDSPF